MMLRIHSAIHAAVRTLLLFAGIFSIFAFSPVYAITADSLPSSNTSSSECAACTNAFDEDGDVDAFTTEEDEMGDQQQDDAEHHTSMGAQDDGGVSVSDEDDGSVLGNDEQSDDRGDEYDHENDNDRHGNTITIVASKVVCDDEADLPNWGNGGPVITEHTARDWVASHDGCELTSGWSFQWGDQDVEDPGETFYGEAGGGWSTFGPTNEHGIASVVIDLVDSLQLIWVREVLQEGYIAFTYEDEGAENANDVSAEMYCDRDVLNYDNYDYIVPEEAGDVYYCVAFNAPAPSGDENPSAACSDGIDNDHDGLIDADDPGCRTDGSDASTYNPADTDESDDEAPAYGPYCGDGEVNQPWEKCDGTDSCTVTCQEQTDMCVDDVFARVVIEGVDNRGDTANMSDRVYLGGADAPIPSGTWFPVRLGGSPIVDGPIASYEDVPGLAVERGTDYVRVRLSGSHEPDGTREHVNGFIEFSDRVESVTLTNDLEGDTPQDGANNWLEPKNGGWNAPHPAGDTAMDAGRDYAWSAASTTSNFWLTVTTADDGYFTYYTAPACQAINHRPVITLIKDIVVLLVGDSFDPLDGYATAYDIEDGDLTGNLVATGTVDTSVSGTSTVTYSVVDSEGLAADPAVLTVVVRDESIDDTFACSDGIDNDHDGLIDADDPGCRTDGSDASTYNPADTDEFDDEAPACEPVVVVSGTDMTVDDMAHAVLTYANHPAWTAVIAGAQWVWSTYLVEHPEMTVAHTFSRDFSITGKVGSTTLEVAADNSYIVWINGTELGADMTPDNFSEEGKDRYTGFADLLHNGTNTIAFEVKNIGQNTTPERNPAGLLFRLEVQIAGDSCVAATNTPPIIQGADTPARIYIDETDIEATLRTGVTAFDEEDGDITDQIVIEGMGEIATSTLATTTVVYRVTDSGAPTGHAQTAHVERVVEIVSQCSDGIDNDGDGTIDFDGAVVDGDMVYPPDSDCADAMDNSEAGTGSPSINTPPMIQGADTVLVIPQGATTSLDELARRGVTATDTEDGDITDRIIITGLDMIATSTTGTTTITYSVTDSGAPTGVPRTSSVDRPVSVVARGSSACSDGIDNDGDGLIDADDPACHTDGNAANTDSYDAERNSENTPPVLSLVGDAVVTITTGTVYVDAGVTATDREDGDLSSSVVVDGLPIDTAVPGEHTVTYTVSDSLGAAATPVVRTVRVVEPVIVSSGGGRGGIGGGFAITPLRIYNEAAEYVGGGTVVITWKTNLPATSQVAYGTTSVAHPRFPERYGYATVTPEYTNASLTHSVSITGLQEGVTYYFRPVSDHELAAEVYGDELSVLIGAVDAVPAKGEVNTCTYLLEFIKYGAVNNPSEVRKLQRFLNEFEGARLAETGIYDEPTYEALKKFQVKYADNILKPWGYDKPTGYVYLTTKKKINELYCGAPLRFSPDQEREIETFRAAYGVAQNSPDDNDRIELGDFEVPATDESVEGLIGGAVESENGAGEYAGKNSRLAERNGAKTVPSTEMIRSGHGDDGSTTPRLTATSTERGLASVVSSGIRNIIADYFWPILVLLNVLLIVQVVRLLSLGKKGAESDTDTQ